jgi:hypothetical protein
MAAGMQDFVTDPSDLTPPSAPAQHASGPPIATLGGYQYRTSDPRAEILSSEAI